MNFWEKLPAPFFAQAPMADVTDAAYRKIIASKQNPHVMWTEFVSADGLYHTREIQKIPDAENPLMRDLQFSEGEHPIVAQLFSSNPHTMEYAARLCAELGFDGIDINMGCPDKSIEKQGCGAAMIKTPEKAKEIIEAARRGASELPVSVKTRIGYNQESIDTWIPELLSTHLPALTVHLRTRKEMSKVAAHWDLLPRIVALRDQISPETLIIGNGDVESMAEAREKIQSSGADGIMFGRAIFGNPWLYTGTPIEEIPLQDKLDALASLARGFESLHPPKSFHILKKHVKAFVSGFDGAAELRAQLMETESAAQMDAILESFK